MTRTDAPTYLVSDLARAVGLSRATLLYYERIGLLRGRRQANGYRVYTEGDRRRLAMQRLQAAGLSLAECRACLDGQLDAGLLAARLDTLEAEIAAKTRARDLVAGLPGRGSLRDWHDEIERVAPDLHRAWLMRQGFTGAEAGKVALLSRAGAAARQSRRDPRDRLRPRRGHPAARRRNRRAHHCDRHRHGRAGPARGRRRGIGSCRADHHRRAGHGRPARTRHPLRHDPGRGQRPYHRRRPRWRCGGPCCGPAARWSCRTWSGAAPPPTRSSAPSGRANTPTWPMSPPACHRHGPRATACGAGSTPAPRRSTPIIPPSPPAWPRWRGRLSGTQVPADLTAGLDCWRNARGQFGYELFVLQRP